MQKKGGVEMEGKVKEKVEMEEIVEVGGGGGRWRSTCKWMWDVG